MCSCSKKGDLADPNKWRGGVLMDVCSEIFSSDMNYRAFRLLELMVHDFSLAGHRK